MRKRLTVSDPEGREPAPDEDPAQGDDSAPEDDSAARSGADARSASLRKDWLTTTATSIVIGVIVFAAAPIAANRLGAAGRGTLVTVQLLPQIFADLASVGLGFAVIHYGSQRPGSIRQLWKWSLARCALGAVVTFAAGHAIAPLLTNNIDDERMLRIYLLLCPILAFTTVPLEALRALGRFASWNAFTFIRQVAWPVALLTGVLQPTPSLWLVVWLHLASAAIILVILHVVLWRLTRGDEAEPTVDRSGYLRYGVKSALSTIPASANAKLDQLVMTALVTKDQLGLYAAASGWSQMSLPVMRGLIAVSMPFVSAAGEDNRVERVRRLCTLGMASVVVLGVGGLGVTAVLWRPLYGAEFAPALAAALVMMIATLLLQYNALLGNVLRSLERPGLVALIEGAIVAGSTAALLVVLRLSPVTGAALVSLLTYMVASATYSVIIGRRLGVAPTSLIDVTAVRQLARTIRRR